MKTYIERTSENSWIVQTEKEQLAVSFVEMAAFLGLDYTCDGVMVGKTVIPFAEYDFNEFDIQEYVKSKFN